jgi:hypothetical protein
MLETLHDVPEGIVGVRAVGKLTRDDYEKVLEPIMDGARSEGRRLRVLYELGPEFTGFTPGAAWEDAKLGLRSLRSYEACAVVTDRGWVRDAARIARFIMPCPVRAFSSGEREEALAWLGEGPREVGLSHRLIEDKGVLVIEPRRAMTAQDFDALALEVDPWIEAHGGLQGVVVHAHAFPGWENLGSLIRHVQFFRDHRQKIRRIALAVDGKLASALAPRVGERIVQADVRAFPYDQLPAAVDWAAGDVGVEESAPAGM